MRPAAGGRILKLIESEGSPVPPKKGNKRDEMLATAIIQVERSGLPEPARDRITVTLREGEDADLAEDKVTTLIESERGYLSGCNPGNPGAAVTGLGGTGRIEIVTDRAERIPKMLDALLDPKDKSVVSLREAYIELTGDKRITGDTRNVDRTRLHEAITVGTGAGAGVFAQVFGDSLTRRMQKLYNESMPIYDWYRKVCTEVPVMDFRTQRRVRWGGYGDLPTVLQGAVYTALTSPKDEEETYSATKKGGTEVITLESIKNDDVGVLMSLPRRLAMAAKRTLSTAVAGSFTANSGGGQLLGADSKNLFHADHNNTGTAALTATSAAAGRLAMVKQTEMDSTKQIGIEPKTLLVPFELQEVGFNLFRMGVNNDRDFVQQLLYDVTPVPGWTDANDWVLAADPMMIETIEIGYLDGMMEPALMVQADEHYGSMFTNDQWTYKIRHIYGLTVMDYRGFYKGIVA